MTWERGSLLAKAVLFFERAFDQAPDDPLFGLWCSLGLELLARSALASVSPTLLAEPDRDHRFLLHALDRADKSVQPQSIGAMQVLILCQRLFTEFSAEDVAVAKALINRRNAELHSGAAAFEEYPSTIWLSGFYKACSALAEVLGEQLEDLLGEDRAKLAQQVIAESRADVTSRVLSAIATCARTFSLKAEAERQVALETSKREATVLIRERHHRVVCPACGSDALVQGDVFGPERVTHEEGEIVVRQSVAPRTFACRSCELKLNGYAELEAAKLAGNYTRTRMFTPESYYGLVDPLTADLSPYMDRYIQSYLEDIGNEYDNE